MFSTRPLNYGKPQNMFGLCPLSGLQKLNRTLHVRGVRSCPCTRPFGNIFGPLIQWRQWRQILMLQHGECTDPKSFLNPTKKIETCYNSRLMHGFIMTNAVIAYGCNAQVSRYFWPFAIIAGGNRWDSKLKWSVALHFLNWLHFLLQSMQHGAFTLFIHICVLFRLLCC